MASSASGPGAPGRRRHVPDAGSHAALSPGRTLTRGPLISAPGLIARAAPPVHTMTGPVSGEM